jgi:hypothetical protein
LLISDFWWRLIILEVRTSCSTSATLSKSMMVPIHAQTTSLLAASPMHPRVARISLRP